MSQSTVDEILGLIDALPARERELLDQKLAERLEADWRVETAEARRQARLRGIDQAVIDEAIHALRYESVRIISMANHHELLRNEGLIE